MLKTLMSWCLIPVTAWKQKEVILETAFFLAFLFSQMNIKNLKSVGKNVLRVFCIELSVGEVCSLQKKCSSLLVGGRGGAQAKKSPQNQTHVEGTEESAETQYQAVPCSGVEELVGLPSLRGLVRWSGYKRIFYKLPNLFLLMFYR